MAKLFLLILTSCMAGFNASHLVKLKSNLGYQFHFEGKDRYDPLSYDLVYPTNIVTACPGNGEVCIIEVSNSDIYTIFDAPLPWFIGKPKVDIQTSASGELADDIATALATPGESTVAVHSRIIFERN